MISLVCIGRKPDGVCLVVGSCCCGFKENSNSESQVRVKVIKVLDHHSRRLEMQCQVLIDPQISGLLTSMQF